MALEAGRRQQGTELSVAHVRQLEGHCPHLQGQYVSVNHVSEHRNSYTGWRGETPAKGQGLGEEQTPATLRPSHTSDRYKSQLWKGQSKLRKARLGETQETVKG